MQRLRVLKPCIVLDAGTGAGVMTKALGDGLESFIVSIDANKRVFPHVLKKVDRNRVDLLACDFAHLPFKESVFCAILCDLVISTSREWEPFSTYAEFKRVVKTKASLFITDYFPEKSPRTKEALLAAKTSSLYRTVSRAKGMEVQKSVPPESSVRQLSKTGFATIRMERIKANEAQEWKKRVLKEYCKGMQTEITDLADFKLKTRFMNKLKELKREIDGGGRIMWGWGANYLITATK